MEQKKYSKLLRIWHWLNFVSISGLLATFFLRKTFLSWRDNSQIIVERLASFDIEISATQAKTIAKAIRAPMWEWHIIFGVMLAILLLFRLFIIYREGGFGYQKSSLHMNMVHLGYKAFYIILIFMTISGLAINSYELLGLSKDFTHSIKEMHEIVAWSVVIFVPLHIIGVVIADNQDQKGIVSKMISG
ncbi:Ni,Fe-hydrogenase I cytochrome b subunit [hydrothermal vent metagenome]|uniref:Ni,Fe-hydrogenase I cytochrome b subunit n=1 Tax=hydrothermal vent metagenome TaxID=652676 RepID=A0A1W1BN96_9ZZZZ